jgi:hypothetical protein
MERCAYLVNSTPKYYGLLPLHFTLLKRYAPWLPFKLILATEAPGHPICRQLRDEFGVEILELSASEAGFLDSRAVALQQLARTGRFDYVLPMQEDFLLDRTPDAIAITEAFEIMAASPIIASMRLTPCPGPKGPNFLSKPSWAGMTPETDTYGFSFQATLWRLDVCALWYKRLCEKLETEWPLATTAPDQRRHIEIRANYAENAEGQRFFWKFSKERGQVHLGWIRAGQWPNAVYLCPWPYRPTAIVLGKLESWAAELGRREGVAIKDLA